MSQNPAKNPAEILAKRITIPVSSAMTDADFQAQIAAITAESIGKIEQGRGEQKQKAIESSINRSGIPRRFVGRSFENYEAQSVNQQRAKKQCMAYAERFDSVLDKGVCMVLSGEPGTGKTHLAVSVLRAAMDRGHTGLFITVSEMLRHIRSSYSATSHESEIDIFYRYQSVDLLVLDEVGVSIGDDDKRKALIFDVFNARYNAMKPTIILGNLNQQEMRDYLGFRVWDRIKENGAPVIPFDWESYRK